MNTSFYKPKYQIDWKNLIDISKLLKRIGDMKFDSKFVWRPMV